MPMILHLYRVFLEWQLVPVMSFPRNLEQLDGTTGFKTGLELDDSNGFGRLHGGMFVDKSTNKYIQVVHGMFRV
jgi:hypothetical protein